MKNSFCYPELWYSKDYKQIEYNYTYGYFYHEVCQWNNEAKNYQVTSEHPPTHTATL